MFSRVLIANRGEIAVRIARTCRELGIAPLAVYSDVDAAALHVTTADDAVHLPGVAPTDTYLDKGAVIDAATSLGAEAIHPGYGFLAEKQDFAQAVIDAGLVWIGPPPAAMALVGDKISARRTAEGAGVPVVPGLLDAVEDVAEVQAFAETHGFPIAIKASGGGGGRGLKVARSADEVVDAFDSARREAEAYFGSSAVYVERYLDAPKHLEVQILSPSPDDALWLGVRDCSLQRRHQKLIEETPPPTAEHLAPGMGAAAVAIAKACGYVNAGTVEMLMQDDRFYFLEVNARLQVEHTVTEELFGVDLVACQLRIAAGEALGFGQEDLVPRGHSIECRINAEDPGRGFIPSPGRLSAYKEPGGRGIRVDSGYRAGDSLPAAYDSLLAKLIATGADRVEARTKMLRALDEFVIEGLSSTIEAHKLLLASPEFVEGIHTTRTIEDGSVLDALQSAEIQLEERDYLLINGLHVALWSPSMSASAVAAVHESGTGGGGDIRAPMQGTILKVVATVGDRVEVGDAIVILEAMKMETTLAAPSTGTVAEIRVAAGETAASGDVVAVITPGDAPPASPDQG
ncbi:MAG TPA: biotin carboxylase N-terminal domain-containing protein [Actinomycetota bacterium]|nr:biotin carboxylase N-terminal domain-containing protein [Actinomycetota bacterium]